MNAAFGANKKFAGNYQEIFLFLLFFMIFNSQGTSDLVFSPIPKRERCSNDNKISFFALQLSWIRLLYVE